MTILTKGASRRMASGMYGNPHVWPSERFGTDLYRNR